MPNKPTLFFPALTGIRALAAYLVFIAHHKEILIFLKNPVFTNTHTGHTGVTIFFVLSGFLISYKYADSFKQTSFSKINYFKRRFARIYPVYIILTVTLLIWKKDFSLWHWFLNLTLLKGFFETERFTGIIPAWSLTVEETFYLTAPFLLILFRKYGILVLIGLVSTGLILVKVADFFHSESFMNNTEFMVNLTFFGRCFEFYCGVWLANIFKHKKVIPVLNIRKLNYTYLGLMLLIGLEVITNIVQLNNLLIWSIPIDILLKSFVLPISIGIFFWGLLIEKTIISQILSSKPAVILGKSSYVFYLIHTDLFFEFIYFHLSPNIAIIFVALNLASILIFIFIEQPFNQYINSFKGLKFHKYFHKNILLK